MAGVLITWVRGVNSAGLRIHNAHRFWGGGSYNVKKYEDHQQLVVISRIYRKNEDRNVSCSAAAFCTLGCNKTFL